MKQAYWKKILSYFFEFSLEKTSSDYNPHLEVVLVEGRHQLQTADAIYSFDDKYENFNQTFKQIDWDRLPGNKVLVLGLGLGSVILLLEKRYKRKFDYTAIEIDPEICKLAQKYTLQYLDSYIEIFPIDGMQYLENESKTYDIIIMDIFQNALIPQIFQSLDFIKLLKSKLNKQGLLLFNRMNITEKDKVENEAFHGRFESVFSNYKKLFIKDNIMYASTKTPFLN